MPALEEYRRKRDFRRTSEPRGGRAPRVRARRRAPASRRELSFVIQKHAASRLHYEKGRLAFVLEGEKLRGAWALVRMRGKEGEKSPWLLVKERDRFARNGSTKSVVDARPESVATGRKIDEIGRRGATEREWSSDRPAARRPRERPRVPPKPTRKGPPKRDPGRKAPVKEPPPEDPPKPPVREPPDEVREASHRGVRVSVTVSTPVAWSELTARLEPGRLTVGTVPKRLLRADPWAGMEHVRQTITGPMLRAAARKTPSRSV